MSSPEYSIKNQAESKASSSEDVSASDILRDHSMELSKAAVSIGHKLDQAEERALATGLNQLSTNFYSQIDKAATDPKWLPEHFMGVSGWAEVPVNDGSGDRISMNLIAMSAKVDRDLSAHGDSQDKFKAQVLGPALEKALQNPEGSTDLSNLSLNFSPSDGKGAAEFSGNMASLSALRIDSQDHTPLGDAMNIRESVDQLTRRHADKYALNDLHDIAVSLTKDHSAFTKAFKEDLSYLQAKGELPTTSLLPGSVIDVTITDTTGKKVGEIVASPTKPTVFKELRN